MPVQPSGMVSSWVRAVSLGRKDPIPAAFQRTRPSSLLGLLVNPVSFAWVDDVLILLKRRFAARKVPAVQPA